MCAAVTCECRFVHEAAPSQASGEPHFRTFKNPLSMIPATGWCTNPGVIAGEVADAVGKDAMNSETAAKFAYRASML
jgi:hypothetical protein